MGGHDEGDGEDIVGMESDSLACVQTNYQSKLAFTDAFTPKFQLVSVRPAAGLWI